MIGNDVVDLELAATQSNWTRKRFLEKVFTASEVGQICSDANPGLLVWLFWSMKEAAYKAHQRRFLLHRKLNWKTQECQLLEMDCAKASGVVKIGRELYFSKSRISSEAVFTSAVPHPEIPVKEVLSQQPPEVAKKNFIQEISGHLEIPSEELILQKNEQGVPFLLYRRGILPSSFSFTGHGRFSGFSFPVNELLNTR